MNSGSKLTPCFIPARIISRTGSHKVNLTRIGVHKGQLSGDIPLDAGENAEMELHRPTDGQLVRVPIEISSVRREGQQWGWLPAIHVTLACSLDECEAVDPAESGIHLSIDDRSTDSASDDDESIVEVISHDDETLPPGAIGPATDRELAVATASMSGEIQTLDIPVGAGRPGVHTLDDIVPPGEHKEPEPELRVVSPPWEDGQPQDDAPPWEEDPEAAADDPRAEGQYPEPEGSPRRSSAATPWTPADDRDDDDREVRILSEVTVSYLSAGNKRFGTAQDFSLQGMFLAVPVGDPLPRLGAFVRVGFPIELRDDLFVVRMTAEVRWQHGQGEPNAEGRGVGLQISAFDSATEQQVFDSYVHSLIADEDD